MKSFDQIIAKAKVAGYLDTDFIYEEYGAGARLLIPNGTDQPWPFADFPSHIDAERFLDLLGEIKRHALATEWIPVEERLPARYETVIGRDQFYGRVGEAHIAGWGEPHLVFIDSDDCSITHWRPFPAGPEVAGDEEE